MNFRKLRNIEVSSIGYGCMGFSHGYGEIPSEEEAIRLMRLAYDKGCTFFDTAEAYGDGHNERLVGKAIEPFREHIILASKLFIDSEAVGDSFESLEAHIRAHLDASLDKLRTDYLDIYYQHRVNDDIPVEDVARVMGKLIVEGKIRGWGQSQPTAEQIRRAHEITPLTAVQSEYSMMERQFEQDVIPTCKELNIGFVPFSPLASGFLSGKYSNEDQYQGDDVRRVITRFNKENVNKNQPLIDLIQKYADEQQATPAQISLAWMMYKEPFIVPIPGMRKENRVDENLGAADVKLTDEAYLALEHELSKIQVYGNRTDKDIAKLQDME
ncbi:aldehyde oxidase [Staphylococcus gallinarum]|uniref:aldo/keto reductase n=1 Tax=Staphylococcus TaxID=1279 RepID=UPI000D1EED9C|nr:aldo/keto reductase [Staphylococcus gallinarum]MCD8820681.1 aldo/keto reductase [Staphylococcus gallinarum]PTK93239.1 aldehyde oxidase [Staphylococcus gallinarum]PTL09728.1 aldehyde oxidase [Staphylococcus gallinarum]PTL12695.1 aldehyde oxidase [Staphylococcus gallinarum]RIL35359.1 aldo/keto reductase [Staphylococcus gallinarum]